MEEGTVQNVTDPLESLEVPEGRMGHGGDPRPGDNTVGGCRPLMADCMGGNFPLRRRRTHNTINNSRDSPILLDEEEDKRYRSCWNLKDVSEAYFRSYASQLFMFSLSVFACVLYVFETYYDNPFQNVVFISLEVFLSLTFLVDYVLTLAFALDRWRYVVSFNGIIDLVSILPLVPFLVHSFTHGRIKRWMETWIEIGSLCRVLRGLKVFRVMRFFPDSSAGVPMPYSRRRLTSPKPFDNSNSVTVRIIKLSFWLCGTIFISTGLVYFIDTHEHNKSFSLPSDMATFQWFDALYFISVTLATVGYGDIVPSSFLSRMVVLCTIFFFLCCIPYQVGKLVEAISSKSAYRTAAFRPVRNTEHAVLLGTITYPVLASFVEQFLHGNERLEHNFRLVILSPTEPDPWLQSLLKHPRYQDRVMYLHGSPWSAEDLRRAGAGHAQAIFIQADFLGQDIQKDQDRILLTAVAARKYLVRQFDTTTFPFSDEEEEEDNFLIRTVSSLGLLPSTRSKDASATRSPRKPVKTLAPSSSPLPLDQEGSRDVENPVSGLEPARQTSVPWLSRIRSNSYLRGALSVLEQGINSLGDERVREEQEEPDEQLSERIIIQTHTATAMEELTRGLGFRHAYCPHIIRLRLMAYGVAFPGLLSFFMILLKGDPFGGEERTKEPAWFKTFRGGGRQRVVRHELAVIPDSPLEGRTFAEVARYLYRRFGLVMVGLEVNGVFLLNPHHYYRFHSSRVRAVGAYFIVSGWQVVHAAFEKLKHQNLNRLDVLASLAERPRIKLRASDLPPPRITRLRSMQCSNAGRARNTKSASTSSETMVRDTFPSAGDRREDHDPKDESAPPRHAQRPSRTYHQAQLHRTLRARHKDMLSEAHRILQEAHDDHVRRTRESNGISRYLHDWEEMPGEAFLASSRSTDKVTENGSSSGGTNSHQDTQDSESLDESAKNGRVSDTREWWRLKPRGGQEETQHCSKHSAQTPVFVDSVVKKVQGARDMLTQLLDANHSPLPEGGLRNHVVLGLCNEAAQSADTFIQFVSAFRKLLHMPIVVLCTDSNRFATLLQGLRQRLRQTSRAVRDLEAPNTRDIYFIKGSPKIRADLQYCCVENAYAVVLLGDDIPRRQDQVGERDPVLVDRHVLLSSFKLEGILRERLYTRVFTVVDLWNEPNMDLLRQRVRFSGQFSAMSAGASGHPRLSNSTKAWPPHADAIRGNSKSQPVAISAASTEALTNTRLNAHHDAGALSVSRHGQYNTDLPHQEAYYGHRYGDDVKRRSRAQSFVPIPERASLPEHGSPLFAAGRVCCRSFFDVFFIYMYKNPYALRLWKEVIRSSSDDLLGDEFQVGTCATASEGEILDAEMLKEMLGDATDDTGQKDVDAEVPFGYTGRDLYCDSTGLDDAPPEVENLQDSIDLLRSSLDEMPLPRAFLGARYADLVDAFMHMGLVPIGLYRPRGLMDAPLPFSVVNPPPDTKMVRSDLIFVLRPAGIFESREKGPAANPNAGGLSAPKAQIVCHNHQNKVYVDPTSNSPVCT